MPDDAEEVAALRAEVERLRRDVAGAREAARLAEAAAGRARGEYVERYVQLERARQDQARFQESVVGKLWMGWHHTVDRVRAQVRRGRQR